MDFTNLDPVTAAGLQRRGFDPREVDQATEWLLDYISTSLLPEFPFPATGRLAALPSSDGFDHFSRLPIQLLQNIVARLPVTDAARTAVLSSRWRKIWLRVPAVIIDTYLRTEAPTLANSAAITAAVSSILESHPGPFARVDLVCSHMSAYRAELARWLELLVAKGVQELVIVNRPWPIDVRLPDALFKIRKLVRLFIGLWKLPDTSALGDYWTFPYLRHLGLCCVVTEQQDIEFVVTRSPVLETLSIQGISRGLRLRLQSNTLRCVQICSCRVEQITVVKAPHLECFVMHGCQELAGGLRTTITILDAPSLLTIGYLKPEHQVLQVRKTVISDGMKVSTAAMLTSVNVLALNVRFGHLSEAEMVPTFLRCFPNVKTLHITSVKCNQSTATRTLKDKNVHIKTAFRGLCELYLYEYRGDEGEVAFLRRLFHSADVLKKATITTANLMQVEAIAAAKKAESASAISMSKCPVDFIFGTGPEGGNAWSFQNAFELDDPFSVGA